MKNSKSQIDSEEEEKLMPARINELKAVLKAKHGVEIPRGCDKFLARCVRSKDGGLDKAIKLIIGYQETAVDFKKWNATLQPTLFTEFYESFLISPLLQRDRKGRRLVTFRFRMWDPEEMNFDELIFACYMVAQHLLKESTEVQRKGFSVIYDYSNFTLKHAWAVKHWRLLAMAKWTQNGVVGRLKGIHVLFYPKFVTAIYAAIKPFLKEKIKKRVYFHDNLDSLYQHVDPKGLPKYLGGELEPNSDVCIDKRFLKELHLQDTYFKDFMTKQFPCE